MKDIENFGLYREHDRNHDALYRTQVINHYSNGKNCCARCGCDNFHLLTIDHIDNNGASHRKELGYSGITKWLINHEYPKGYQILCRNCNWLKSIYFNDHYKLYRKRYNVKQEEFNNLNKIDFPYYNIPDELFKE